MSEQSKQRWRNIRTILYQAIATILATLAGALGENNLNLIP